MEKTTEERGSTAGSITNDAPAYHGEDPLFSSGAELKKIHHRNIDFAGYMRSDGLFQVQGRVMDQRPQGSLEPETSPVTDATEMIHDLGIDIIFDANMTVLAVRTVSKTYPYRQCPSGGDALQAIVGMRIGAGWSSEVRKRLPSAGVCAHLKEILIPLASAAYQSMTFQRLRQPDLVDDAGKPRKINSCYAYRDSGELVLSRWPQYHRPDSAKHE